MSKTTIIEATAGTMPSEKKNHKLVLIKDREALALAASTNKKASTSFHSIDIDIHKVSLVASGNEEGPVIFDINYDKIRKTATGFTPRILCVGGINNLRKARQQGRETVKAWVGNRIMAAGITIMADDAISCNDLSTKIRKLVDTNYSKKSPHPDIADDAYAYVVEIYPFENYCIFQKGGDKFRQAYTLDPIMREVKLSDKPVKVFEQYVPVSDSKGVKLLDAGMGSLQEMLYDRPNSVAPALGEHVGPYTSTDFNNGVLVNFGAPGSEANNPAYKLMLNVEEALAMYQTERADKIHKCVFSPLAPVPPGLINARREAQIAASIAGLTDFSAMDFLAWQNKKMHIKAAERRKRIGTKELDASRFAYVGDYGDISTWLCPMHTVQAAAQSIKDLKKAPVPKKAVPAVLTRLKKKAAGPVAGKGKGFHTGLKKIQQKVMPNNGGKVKA